MKFLLEIKFLIDTINHSGILNRRHYCAFIKGTIIGILAMSSCFVMLTKILSAIQRQTLYFTAKFNFFCKIYQSFSWLCKRALLFHTLSLGVTNPHITQLSLLTQFSSIKILQSLVLENDCKEIWPSIILAMKSDDLTNKSQSIQPLILVRLRVRRF